MKSAEIWSCYDDSAAYVGGLTVDADDWPIAMTGGCTNIGTMVPCERAIDEPVVRYVMKWTGGGTGRVYPFGVGSVVTEVTNTANRIEFDVSGGPASNDLQTYSMGVGFRGFTAADPPKNIVIVRKDQEALLASGAIFNPVFLARMRQYSFARTMDWQNTNFTTWKTWAERPKPSNRSWAGTAGVPLEIIVELANQADLNLHVSTPYAADDDLVTRFHTYIRDNLKPSQTCDAERSNEDWNWVFAGYGYAGNAPEAVACWGPGPVHQYNGYLAARHAIIADAVWKATGQRHRLRNLFGTQADYYAQFFVKESGALWGAPSVNGGSTTGPAGGSLPATGITALADVFDALTNACGYYGGTHPVSGSATPDVHADKATIYGWAHSDSAAGYTAAFQSINSGGVLLTAAPNGLGDNSTAIANWRVIAEGRGLSLDGYECGSHNNLPQFNVGEADPWYDVDDVSRRPELTAWSRKLHDDPRQGTVSSSVFKRIREEGMSTFKYFADIGPVTAFGPWGMIAHVNAPNTPRQDALESWMRNPGVAFRPLSIAIANPTNPVAGMSDGKTIIRAMGGTGFHRIVISGDLPPGRVHNRRVVSGVYGAGAAGGSFTWTATVTDLFTGQTASATVTETIAAPSPYDRFVALRMVKNGEGTLCTAAGWACLVGEVELYDRQGAVIPESRFIRTSNGYYNQPYDGPTGYGPDRTADGDVGTFFGAPGGAMADGSIIMWEAPLGAGEDIGSAIIRCNQTKRPIRFEVRTFASRPAWSEVATSGTRRSADVVLTADVAYTGDACAVSLN